MSIIVRPPETTGWDEYATCNSCHSPDTVAVIEIDPGDGSNTSRLCEQCMDDLVKGATQIKLARLQAEIARTTRTITEGLPET